MFSLFLLTAASEEKDTLIVKKTGEELMYSCVSAPMSEKTIMACAKDTCFFAVRYRTDIRELRQTVISRGRKTEHTLAVFPSGTPVHLRIMASKGSVCFFSYSKDGKNYIPVGDEFNACGQTLRIITSQ